MSQNVYTPTQARQNFFKILKQVEKGSEVIIQPKNSHHHYILTSRKTAKKPTIKEVEAILEEMGKIGISTKGMTADDIDKIIDEDYTRKF